MNSQSPESVTRHRPVLTFQILTVASFDELASLSQAPDLCMGSQLSDVTYCLWLVCDHEKTTEDDFIHNDRQYTKLV